MLTIPQQLSCINITLTILLRYYRRPMFLQFFFCKLNINSWKFYRRNFGKLQSLAIGFFTRMKFPIQLSYFILKLCWHLIMIKYQIWVDLIFHNGTSLNHTTHVYLADSLLILLSLFTLLDYTSVHSWSMFY